MANAAGRSRASALGSTTARDREKIIPADGSALKFSTRETTRPHSDAASSSGRSRPRKDTKVLADRVHRQRGGAYTNQLRAQPSTAAMPDDIHHVIAMPAKPGTVRCRHPDVPQSQTCVLAKRGEPRKRSPPAVIVGGRTQAVQPRARLADDPESAYPRGLHAETASATDPTEGVMVAVGSSTPCLQIRRALE